ncbi:MAG: putative metal-dependent hydrolase [Vicinamibacteria bacterium]|nr:putative metal-dependent hydrolase [Vicinamibacteria bacterium]
MEDIRYPVGRFQPPAPPLSSADRMRHIAEIDGLPVKLNKAVRDLNDAQLDTPYRPGGWTIRQIVHHLADSHMNAYIRFRLALTEHEPMIKPYDEARWAELDDARTGPIDVSLSLLSALHSRLVVLLHSLKPDDWLRAYHHPERGVVPLDTALAMYAWHGRHHVAHITRRLHTHH